MDIRITAEKSFLDALYCDEEKWGELESEVEEENGANLSLFPMLLSQDFFWDDEELKSLFSKEQETFFLHRNYKTGFSISQGRKEAVERILKINSHYGFSALTAILAVNYLDRFCLSLSFNEERPWIMQLTAVTCLSLAAKDEETHVPLLLDLQVEGTKYVFESKNIQRMELLVLSSLKWRMNPVTPLSFLDHIIRRLGLKSFVHWEFLRSCENLLLSVVSDSRFVCYLPSVLATATMLHVIHQFEPSNVIDYETQLISVLKIHKEEMDECYETISDIFSSNGSYLCGKNNPLKRKFCATELSFNRDSSNDSWEAESCISSCSSSPSHQPFYKKNRVQEQQIKLPSLSRVLMDAIGSPH